ncbi:hypothetical protein AB0E62_23765 [Streptomyces sp. NPDC038707]|uniref:hypothetical protein n=1 Tax=Streptomyces sp. NPDC038707 TaxID=3154329 RepID=UPI0033FC92BD
MNRASRQFHTLRIPDASRSVNEVLARTGAVVERIDRDLAGEGESAAAALLSLKDAAPRLTAMRRLMRADLGVGDQAGDTARVASVPQLARRRRDSAVGESGSAW